MSKTSDQNGKSSVFPIGLHLQHLYVEGQLEQEIKKQNIYINEESDFWEWYENKYNVTRKELWAEYEKDTNSEINS